MNARLFLALWPEDSVRGQLAAWRDSWTWPGGATPVRTERLHMTLHFIGDVAEERMAQAGDALSVPLEPFTLALGTAQVWPHGIAVVEPLSTPASLLALQLQLRERLEVMSLPVDARPFRPHVTLARRAGGASRTHDGPGIDWHVNHYALMRSRLGAGGGYEVVRRYPS